MTTWRRQAPNHWRADSGFTVVEVLVSLVVLSVGLLGIAKLILFTARSNDSAYLRSQATELGYQILDEMRANRQTAFSHGYDTSMAAVPNASGSCIGIACSPTELALYDVYTWKRRLAVSTGGALPLGQGSITTTTTAPATTTAVVTVQWDDEAAQSGFGAPVGVPATVQVTLETLL
jgi:type IV pilus assembly protein PilV